MWCFGEEEEAVLRELGSESERIQEKEREESEDPTDTITTHTQRQKKAAVAEGEKGSQIAPFTVNAFQCFPLKQQQRLRSLGRKAPADGATRWPKT